MTKRARVLLAGVLALVATGSSAAEDLSTSQHNLSITGRESVSADTESRTCVFCHTTHSAAPEIALWNHESSGVVYSTYSSTTMSVPTPLKQPTGSSKLCLSCHDGTVALGQTVNNGLISLTNLGSGGRMPDGPANLGTDLTDDHPISFAANAANRETDDPPFGDAVALDAAGEVQCVSCHDPHKEAIDPVTRRFLVKGNQGSALCLTCHRPDYWKSNPSAHESSTATYTATQGAHTGYQTVRDNGCESCHRPHSGNQPQRLLKFVEEATCDACHNGDVATKNVAAAFNKPYSHPTYSTTPSVHDASESPNDPSYPMPEISPGAERHAECQDCHNPHASSSQPAAAPNVSGALAGVWGVDSSGSRIDPAQYEYQICYKCHADSANKPQERGLPNPPYTRRQIVQFNVRLEFDPANPSHHAVQAPGRNNDVPSLLPPYTTSSVIRCSACHNSESTGGGAPSGPHGSVYNHLLERNLNTGDDNFGSDYGEMYALCFKCHDQSSIFGNESFSYHRMHVQEENASCTVCHDPHGISVTQGSTSSNSHLINFDLDVVQPSGGQIRFDDLGLRRGSCTLNCHGENHDSESY